jgi:hypothetical protein
LLGIGDGRVQGAPGDSHGERGDGNPSSVEDDHGLDEPVSFLPQQGLRSDPAVLEVQRGRVANAHAELVLVLSDGNPGRVEGDEEGGYAVMVLPRLRPGHHHRDPSGPGMGDEIL